MTGGTMRLHQRGGGPAGDAGRDIPVFRVTESWSEGGIKWSDPPSVAGDRLDTTHLGTSSGWREWNVDRAAVRWFDRRWDSDGVMVQGFEAGGSYREFDSSEGSDSPELVLEGVLDTIPPVSTMKPLTEFTNVNPFTIEWEGVDPDPATGIDYFVVWARRAGEQWTVVDPQARGTTAVFQGESGKRYEFRVHAVDRAGNAEAPGPIAQATTLLDTNAPVTSVTPLQAFTRGPELTLNWSATEFPQGAGLESSGIAHYDLQWSREGGDWSDLRLGYLGTTLTIAVDHGQSLAFRVRAVDRALNIEPFGSNLTQTVIDTLPPRVWFLPTSGVDSPEFVVRWTATDRAGSGVASYDVQSRIGDGPWMDWVAPTTDTSRTYVGEYGQHYSFRARARDAVGNQGAYPIGAQLHVTVIASSEFTSTLYLPYVLGSTPPGQPPGGG